MSSDDVVTDTIPAASASASVTTSENAIEAEAIDSLTFEVGEKVLSFHGSCLYDAKIQKVQTGSDGRTSYHVHYLGWKKKWDEWLYVDRLLKHTTENFRRQKELNKKLNMNKNVNTGLSHDKHKRSIGLRGKKRHRETIDKDVSVSPRKKFNISIPRDLKKQLVDDHESITELGQLVKLPRSPNVHGILNKYFDYRMKKDGKKIDSVSEIVEGLNKYFDKALPTVLLYKNERQQYEEVVVDNVSPSIVYGAEHLLRLFVKLPEMLSCIQIEMESINQLKEQSLDLLRFLQINQSDFFLSNYQTGGGGDDD